MRATEVLARSVITAGGLATIFAMGLILVFLVWVVVPLFRGARVEEVRSVASPALLAGGVQPHMGVDDRRLVGWAMNAAGKVTSFRLDTGDVLESRDLATGARLTSTAFPPGTDEAAFGWSDGTVRIGRIGLSSRFLLPDTSSAVSPAQGSAAKQLTRAGNALIERMPDGVVRRVELNVALDDAIDTGATTPITHLDLARGATTRIAARSADGVIHFVDVKHQENLLTGETTNQTTLASMPAPPGLGEPSYVLLSGAGDSLYVAWRDGRVLRYDVRTAEAPVLAEELDLAEGNATLESLTFLLGKATLIVGDSAGRVSAWFAAKPDRASTPDGVHLVRAHELSSSGAAVRVVTSSARTRVIAIARVDGSISLHHVTSQKELWSSTDAALRETGALVIAPREDCLLALGPASLHSFEVDLRHPEATASALFLPVWYEGEPAPVHVWQSSSGSDDFEPKLGLWPLVFGTLKATLYSMLFGVPIALLAALYTSEFLKKSLRVPLKSITELMASLPSVVLGFISAMILAPIVQERTTAVLFAFVTVPFALLLGAQAWRVLPESWTLRFGGMPRFLAMAACLPIGVVLAIAIAPAVERGLFGGDFHGWLAHTGGSSFGGWLLLGLPLSAIAAAFVISRVMSTMLASRSRTWDRNRSAVAGVLAFLGGTLLAGIFDYGFARTLEALWMDPRGTFLDTYQQRNALIVGFVMGFAIIPIVYTLAEDALSSVPAHLRLASLAAGATPWQTAIRVVVPTAMSGIFSAVMMGLGRAVGETMIVLMAAGNTPVLSLNPFEGFRTLSANIATELPEAVKDSTHYRTLFLAALCLFGLTFVLNTAAEIVKTRFKKRALSL